MAMISFRIHIDSQKMIRMLLQRAITSFKVKTQSIIQYQ